MDDAVLAEIRRLEERLLQPEVRRSVDALNELIADDFIGIGSAGRAHSREEIIQSLRKESERQFSLVKCHGMMLSPDMALLNYRLEAVGGPRNSVEYTVRSSIWKQVDGRWKIVFHQGTREEPPKNRQ